MKRSSPQAGAHVGLRALGHQVDRLLPLREEPGAHHLPARLVPLGHEGTASVLVKLAPEGSVGQFLAAALVVELLRRFHLSSSGF